MGYKWQLRSRLSYPPDLPRRKGVFLAICTVTIPRQPAFRRFNNQSDNVMQNSHNDSIYQTFWGVEETLHSVYWLLNKSNFATLESLS